MIASILRDDSAERSLEDTIFNDHDFFSFGAIVIVFIGRQLLFMRWVKTDVEKQRTYTIVITNVYLRSYSVISIAFVETSLDSKLYMFADCIKFFNPPAPFHDILPLLISRVNIVLSDLRS